MLIAPATRDMVLEEMRKPNADLQRVSRMFGLPVRLIRELQSGDKSTSSFKERHGGLGRPELQQYIVGRTIAGEPWPVSTYIEKARSDYDAGLVEMCQGRDGNWIILYAIPRTKPDYGRPPYFSYEFGA